MELKRVLSMGVIAAVLLTCTYGCGKQTATNANGTATASGAATASTAAAKPKEVKTFKLFVGDNTRLVHNDLFGTPIGKAVTEATGVKLDIEYLVGGTVQQKIGIMLASGDLPDFVNGHEAHQMFIDAGVLVPLENYIEKSGANTKKVYGKIMNQMKRTDGHIYELTPFREAASINQVQRAFWLSAKVLKENNWPTITKWTDYMNIIRDYVKKHPKINGAPTIGYSFISESWRAFTYTSPPVYLSGSPNHGIFTVDGNNKAIFTPTTENGKRFYNDLNTMWNEGLIDKEAFTQNYDQYLAKLTTGRVLGFCDESWEFQQAQQTIVNEKRFDDFYVPMPVVFDDVAQDSDNDFPQVTIREGVSITTSCKDPDAAFKFLDDIQDEKLQKLMFWGVEGEDYLVNDQGRMYRTPEMVKKRLDKEYVKNKGIGDDWWYIFPHGCGKYSDGINYWRIAEDPDDVYMSYQPGEKEILDHYGKKTFYEFCHTSKPTDYGLLWSVTPATGSEEATINTKYLELAYKDIPKMIMAKSKNDFNSIFNDYVKSNDKINIKKYLDFMDKSIQERIAINKDSN